MAILWIPKPKAMQTNRKMKTKIQHSLKFLLVLTFFAAETVLDRTTAVLLVRLRRCEEIRTKPNVVWWALELDDCVWLGQLSSFAYAVLIA